MNPTLIQKLLKDNANDLGEFCEDLKSWGHEMKIKEEQRIKSSGKNNEISKVTINKNEKARKMNNLEKDTKTQSNKSVKIQSKLGFTDYSAWDKFDADGELEKMDYNQNEDSPLTDEYDETSRDEAYLLKEKGNKFVKEKKWDEALKCYHKAIDLYSYDAVFYANRALCFLKKDNYTNAELDTTISLKLDSTYVKAYQRRAAAREALGKLKEAESDLLKVLELEPNNKESKDNLERIIMQLQEGQQHQEKQRPLSKFTASRNKRKESNNLTSTNSAHKTIITNKNEDKKINIDSDFDSYIPIKAVKKPKHLQSKAPLKRIHIQEIADIEDLSTKLNKEVATSNFHTIISNKTLKTDDLKIIEKQPPKEDLCEVNNENCLNNDEMKEFLQSEIPKNFIQFYALWKTLKTVDDKYEYLNLIKPQNLPRIFGESLESNIFSEYLEVISEYSIKNNVDTFEFLVALTEMKRFSTMVMFMTCNDKTHLEKLLAHFKHHEWHSDQEIKILFTKYESCL